MKRIFIILTVVFILILLTITALAEDNKTLYEQQYNSSGLEETENLLPKEVTQGLDSLGVDISDPQSLGNIDIKNVFKIVWEFLSTGAKKPLKIITAILGLILIFAAGEGLVTETPGSAFYMIICFGATLIMLEPAFEMVKGVEVAVKGITTFMLTFVPVYGGIMASSGLVSSAGGFSSLLLLATEVLAQFVSFGFVPIMGGFLCLGIGGGISPIAGVSKIAEFIKKSANWLMGIVTSVFVGVLAVQTSLQSAADTLGIRTSKAVLSGSIPIMGPAIAETLSAAKQCLGILRSGAGIYGALAVILIVAPIACELLIWRLGLWLCAGVAEVFSLNQAATLVRSVDFCFAILIGALTFVALLFIISLTIISSSGGG